MTPIDVSYPTRPVPSKTAALFYGCYFGVLGLVNPFLGPYLQSRGAAAVAVGLITAAFSLAKVVYTPFLGVVVDRGRWFRGVLSLHVLVSLVAAVAVLGADGSWALLAAFLLVGIGYGSVLPLVEASVLERLPSAGYGALRLWGSVGFVAVAALSASFLQGPSLARFPLLLALLLLALAVACVPFETRARPLPPVAPTPISIGLWLLFLVLTLNQAAHGPYYAFFSIHLSTAGLGNLAISLLWSVGVAAELVAFLLAPLLERRLGLLRLLGWALFLTPFRWLLLALTPSWPVLLLAQTGHAVSFALAHLAGVQLVQHFAPPSSRRFAQSLYSGVVFGLGIVVGSALAGPLYGALAGPGSFLAAALLSGLVFVLWLPVARLLENNKPTTAG